MSEKAPEKPREFQPVEDPAEARKFLREGAKTFASAMIWSKEQKYVLHSHLNVYAESEQILYAWIPKDIDPAQLMDQLIEVGSKECYFSVSLSRANLFFKATYLDFDEGGFKFRAPTQVFKVQRRKDMRFPIPDGIVLRAEIQDPLFPDQLLSKKIIDISASGLAFNVTEAEASIFPTGLTLKNVTFTIRGRKILVDAEVRHARAQPVDSRISGFKVGILFKHLREADSQWIASYVFEEGRKYFSKFM